MSNIGSTALQTSKQEQTRGPQAGPRGQRQRAFDRGTMSMLDDARQMVENAAGQGMQLNPLIYEMLGLKPTMTPGADVGAAQQNFETLQSQLNNAQTTFDQIKSLPKNKRSPEQRKQFRQLKKQIPLLQKSTEDAKAQFNEAQTMPYTITGFERMDPNAIDKSSPFSAQNPLFQAQQTEAERLNQFLAGGEVDPTLKQQYNAAEQALRAKLTERFGPDYESTSVGQMALQNFSRQKNEAFATWNQQQVEKYNALAFQGQANLQTLLANQIGLMREPSTWQAGAGKGISDLTGQRLNQANQNLAERSAREGLTVNTSNYNPASTIAGAASSPAMQKLADAGWQAVKSGASSLYDWATGAGAAAGADAAVGTGTVLAAEPAAEGSLSWMLGY